MSDFEFFRAPKMKEGTTEKVPELVNDAVIAVEKLAQTTGSLVKSLDTKEGVPQGYKSNYNEIEEAICLSIQKLRLLQDSLSDLHPEAVVFKKG